MSKLDELEKEWLAADADHDAAYDVACAAEAAAHAAYDVACTAKAAYEKELENDKT